MTLQQKAAQVENDKEAMRAAQQNDRLMETMRILADGGAATRDMLNRLISQYSWDGYLNELEFE